MLVSYIFFFPFLLLGKGYFIATTIEMLCTLEKIDAAGITHYFTCATRTACTTTLLFVVVNSPCLSISVVKQFR